MSHLCVSLSKTASLQQPLSRRLSPADTLPLSVPDECLWADVARLLHCLPIAWALLWALLWAPKRHFCPPAAGSESSELPLRTGASDERQSEGRKAAKRRSRRGNRLSAAAFAARASIQSCRRGRNANVNAISALSTLRTQLSTLSAQLETISGENLREFAPKIVLRAEKKQRSKEAKRKRRTLAQLSADGQSLLIAIRVWLPF